MTNSHIFISSFDLKPSHLNSFSFCKEIHVRFEAEIEEGVRQTKLCMAYQAEGLNKRSLVLDG